MAASRLILVSGPPGCGKSTLAEGLARHVRNAVLLDKDCVDEPFSPGNRGPRYTMDIEPKVLQALLNLATLNLRLGKDVLLDVPWTHILLNTPDLIPRLYDCAREEDATLIVLECVLSPDILRKRITQRGLKRDDAKLSTEGWEQFCHTDRIGATNPLPHYRLAVEESPDALIRKALALIQQSR